MKKAFLILAVSALVGCSVDNSDSCSAEHITTEPYTDYNGLTLEPSMQMHVTPTQITAYYEDTMACMGMTAEGPTVAFKSFSANYVGGAWGFYHASGVIWINTDQDESAGRVRDCNTDAQVLKHEFVHHILTFNDMLEESRSHASVMFSRCGLGVNVDN
jgi:hypothetical protein